MAELGLSLSMPGSSFSTVPLRARITSTEKMHDVAEILVAKPLLSELTPYLSGAAVKLVWKASQRGKSGTFYGYFDRIEAPYARTGGVMNQSYATLRCYGVSYSMKQEGYATFSNYTADAMVRNLAKSFNLSYVIDPHIYQWPSYSQGGKSAWSFVVSLAERIGYTVYMIGTTLFFVDRRTAGGYVRIPYTFKVRDVANNINDALSFEPMTSSGDGVDGSKSGVHSVQGISKYSGDVFSLQQSTAVRYGNTALHPKPFTRNISDRSPTSIAEAQTYVDAAESSSLFTMAAKMTVFGNSGLAPGGLVDISSPNASMRQFSGTWYIIEAVQNLDPKRYTTTLKLGTDGAGTMVQTPRRAGTGTIAIPPTVFGQGFWRAKWAA